MDLKFWGVRGSITNPLSPELYKEKILDILELVQTGDLKDLNSRNSFIDHLPLSLKTTFGGNTSCVTIYEEGKLLILDAGTGIKNLANDLMIGNFPVPENNEYNIIFSHLHLDHINGLPFFTPVHLNNSMIKFYSGHKDFRKFLEMQQDFNFFPVSLESRPCKKEFIEFEESETLNIGGMKLETRKLNHPNGTYSMKITNYSGRSIVYATDGEYTAKTTINKFTDFFKNADVMIFDAQYSFEELAQRYSFGHSTPEVGIDAAVEAGIKKLFLFHHNHDNNDKQIERSYNKAIKYKEEKYPASELEVIIANEGMEITI